MIPQPGPWLGLWCLVLEGDHEAGVAAGLLLVDVHPLDPGVPRPMPSPLHHAVDGLLRPLEERLDGAVRPVPHPPTDPGPLRLSAATVPEEHTLDESVDHDTTADHSLGTLR